MPPKRSSSSVKKKQQRRARLMTNHDVKQHLLHMKEQQTTTTTTLSHGEWIRDQVLQYFQQSSSPPSSSVLLFQDDDRFTVMERYQLTNLVPTELVELDLILDRINDRFTETEQQELLARIQQQQSATTKASVPDDVEMKDVKSETPVKENSAKQANGDTPGANGNSCNTRPSEECKDRRDLRNPL